MQINFIIMKKYLLSLIFFIQCQFIEAQQVLKDNYTPLFSQGKIPVEFTNSIKSKWLEYQKQISTQGLKKSEKIERDEFLINSSIALDGILRSGKVTFNNDIYFYLNKVTEKLLSNNESLKKSIRVYPIGFETSNAFAFNEGALFVHVGLIAKMEHESELAFVLGHEIGHYAKKHSLERYIEQKKIQKKSKEFKVTDENESLKAVRKYSRNQELEADVYGLDLLIKAGYNPYAALSALSSLSKSLLPPSISSFDISLLEKGTLVIPDAYNLTKTDELTKLNINKNTAESNNKFAYNEELSTHPSIELRVKTLDEKLTRSKENANTDYVISKEEFLYIRELCRMELCRIYLLEYKTDLAFYHTNVMLQKYPNNEYLKRMMAICMARMVESSFNNSLRSRMTKNWDTIPELRNANYMIYKMDREEVSLMAIKYNWWARQNSKSPEQFDKILSYIISEYSTKYRRKLTDFAPKESFSRVSVNKLYIKDTLAEQKTTASKKSKITSNRISKHAYTFNKSLSYYALSDLVDDKEFVKFYNQIVLQNEDAISNDNSESDSESEDQTETLENTAIVKDKKSKVEPLSINSIILIEPEYYEVDSRHKEDKIDGLKNELNAFRINDIISETAKASGFNVNLLSTSTIAENDAERFSDYCLLKNWLNEYFIEEKHTKVPTDNDQINQLIKKYDSRYAAVMINLATVSNDFKVFKILTILLSFIYIPLVPIASTAILPDREYAMILAIVDLQENKTVYGNILYFNQKSNSDLIRSQMYALFLTLKGKKRTPIKY